MLSIIVAFVAALIVTLLIVKLASCTQGMLDHDVSSTQKFHIRPVPRIGGLGIFLAFAIGTCFAYWRVESIGKWIACLLASSSFAFGCGILEDWTKRVSARRRLIFTMLSAATGFFLLDGAIVRIDFSLIDQWLPYIWISLPFTVLAVSGIANAVNIIDGFNGLAGVVTMFMLLSLAYVALQVGDAHVMSAALLLVGAIAGFLVWNYPYGLIFLGDGGAYFIGFMLGELAVLLIARNPQVSAWYVFLLMIYPLFEVIFSIYRKKFVRGMSPGVPDGVHLHMLVFRRLVRWTIGKRDARALTRRNSLTSPYLWLLSLMAVIPATVFWSEKWALIAFCILFVITYIWLYMQIVRFNSPRWMILRRTRDKVLKPINTNNDLIGK